MPATVTLCQIPAEQIVFLLRHLGPQRERDLIDSLDVPWSTLSQALATLAAIRRIERHGPDRWRLIPTPAAPTANPGT